MNKRILYLSNLFPSPLCPGRASFNYQQINAISKLVGVDVVCPVPWKERFKNKIRSHDFENYICHYPTYYYTPKFFRRYYGAFLLESVKHVIYQLAKKYDYQAIYSSWIYPDGWAASVLSNQLGIPSYVKVHGSDINLIVNHSKIVPRINECVLRSEKIFCVSQDLKNKLVGMGAPEEKLILNYNGIDKAIFKQRNYGEIIDKYNLSKEKKTLLFVGNLIKEKGIYELISSFVKYKSQDRSSSSQLIVVGDGPCGNDLKDKIRSYGISSQVIFTGRLSLDEVAQLMNYSDVLCLPSYTEGVPNVILEALSCNLPVVATAVGGIPEIAEKDDRVFLCSPMDPEDLCLSICNCLDQDSSVGKTINVTSWSDNARFLLSEMGL